MKLKKGDLVCYGEGPFFGIVLNIWTDASWSGSYMSSRVYWQRMPPRYTGRFKEGTSGVRSMRHNRLYKVIKMADGSIDYESPECEDHLHKTVTKEEQNKKKKEA